MQHCNECQKIPAIVTVDDIIKFWTMPEGCELRTDAFIKRMLSCGFSNDVPLPVRTNMLKWATNEPGEGCNKFVNEVKRILFTDA